MSRLSLASFLALALFLSACGVRNDRAAAQGPQPTPLTAPTERQSTVPVVPGTPAPEASAPQVLLSGGKPTAPDDPAALAEVLLAVELAIRAPDADPQNLEPAGHWQQVAYRKLVQNPDWLDVVLAAMPTELHEAVRGNVLAGMRLAEMHTPRAPSTTPPEPRTLPRWRIVAPPPADELRAYYEEAQADTGVHWTYLAAVNLVETRMGRIRGDSLAGAQGPMQFMPATWGEWGEGDVHDHRDAIMAAGRFLRWGGMPDDVNGAIFRYNRDVRYVDAVRTYAEQMQADPRAYYGYYHWQVYYATGVESVWLQVGYDGTA